MSSDPIEDLFARSEQHAIPMASICERAKVAQSTPSRWKTDRNGATYATIRKLQNALEELIAERAASIASRVKQDAA